MSANTIIVIVILLGALVLFTREKIPVDLTALMVMAALLITGIISPEEGISGFSNSATVTVAAMFVISAGLFRTGALNFVGEFLTKRAKKSYRGGLVLMLLIIGSISAFINDTAVVAIFLPVIIGVAEKADIGPSKFLIPLSYGALLGGVNTLIGTSTNILVSSIAFQHGLRPFGMFEMTPFGIIIFLTGVIYLLITANKLLPDRKKPEDLSREFHLEDYITEIMLLPESKSVHKEIRNSPLIKEMELDIIEINRGENNKFVPSPYTVLMPGDILRVRCNIAKLKELQSRQGIVLKPETSFSDLDLNTEESRLVQAVVTSGSRLRGRTIKNMNFRETYGGTVLAIRHRGRLMRENIGNTILIPGDVLLIEVKRDWLPQLRRNNAFVIVSEVNLYKEKKEKIIPAVLILLFVVLSNALGIFPIVTSAVIGSILSVVFGIITLEQAYRAIEWRVIFLLAGVLTLGIAMEKTGTAGLIASSLIHLLGVYGPTAMVSAFFILTLIFTNFMSNTAAVALIVPIAIITADSLGVNTRPFLMAVTFAASLSFATPVGYQTNTMIFGPGDYKFMDFVKIGLPLDILFWLIASFLIPVFFPF
ncbi:MAG TPA: SLC13 family permease [Ignavibacteriaceae bacterium]|nr:SLC13 family permease [Ignavibacteriaceae bacterium]